MRSAGRGFTLIELIVVVSLVAVFAAIALDRLKFYQEAAEKAGLETTLAAMHSGLQLRVAQLLVKGDAQAIAALAGSNPVQFLSEPPPGYAGELRESQAGLPGGGWYFDPMRREIVYKPALTTHLRVGGGKPGEDARLRFRADVQYAQASGTTPPAFGKAAMVSLQPYAWFKDDGDLPPPESPSGTTGIRRSAQE